MDFLHEYTSDGLCLPGFHWSPERRETCIISVHGILDHILENYFAEEIAKVSVEHGYGFLYGHNRSYGAITDIGTNVINKDGSVKTKHCGTAFDVFEDSVYDIQLWIDTAIKLGYKNVILIAHSMGCNKTVYYLSQNQPSELRGVILMSPSDFSGMAKMDPGYMSLLNEAKSNIAAGRPEKLLSAQIWGFLYLSSATFVNFFENQNLADTLPIIESPSVFTQLGKIKVPILATIGSNDIVIFRSAEEDFELLKSRAAACPDFSYKIINGANHRYMNKGAELANVIINWVEKISK
jgi:alpha-beta hydrolase superfamily lysophospholipase